MLYEETLQDIKNHRKEEEERITQYRARKLNLEYTTFLAAKAQTSSFQLIPEDLARKHSFVTYKKIGKKLYIATKNSNTDKLKQYLGNLTERYTIKFTLVSETTLNKMFELYKEISHTSTAEKGVIKIANEVLENELSDITSLQKVTEKLEKITKDKNFSISKNIEYILTLASLINASDIHIEHSFSGGMVRFRIDGILNTVLNLTASEYRNVLIRIKLVAGMKISALSSAQDGTFVFNVKDNLIAIRASAIPEGRNESLVLRLLDPKNIINALDDLGLHENLIKIFRKEISRPNGIIITTGPTGSGKTTTLYSFLNTIKSSEKKIITLEDPIEYRLEGITQTQIEKSYSFAQGMRAILRQDPEVILVGEIRDEEVLNVAIQASQTGHLVLSTLHTNNAIGAISRMTQMGADKQNLVGSLNMVIAQRLVRIVCKHCAKKIKTSKKERENLNEFVKKLPKDYKEDFNTDEVIVENKDGCNECTKGFKGRIGVFEAFTLTLNIKKAIIETKSLIEIQEVIYREGNISMEQDGVIKILTERTTIGEVNRVFGKII